jgi:diguanylate cyclase (GGDEF)-like protein
LANDGAQAVEKAKVQRFDLILMDIQMPFMDGYQAARAIREFDSLVPIVALTAAAGIEDRDKALSAGMNDHLSKPINQAAFLACLKNTIALEPVSHSATELPPLMTPATMSRVSDWPSDLPSQLIPPIDKGRILIVDDQMTNVKVLANGLKDDYIIVAANSGAKALKLAEANPAPDLILLDVVMPQMDGFEVLRALKNNPKTQKIPVMFVTALDGLVDERHGLELGAVDYITKPFKLPIVQARVLTQMSLKLKTDLLEQASYVDGLTGIANRRNFDLMLNKEVPRLARYARPLGLLMFDIDYFKPFNDHYGHGKGDECLIKVAHALQAVVKRPGDLLARYGGEEFVVLLPEADAQGVASLAERCRQAVEALQYEHAFSDASSWVTVSVGGATAHVNNSEQAIALLKQADDALYQAKEKGRNCVVIKYE